MQRSFRTQLTDGFLLHFFFLQESQDRYAGKKTLSCLNKASSSFKKYEIKIPSDQKAVVLYLNEQYFSSLSDHQIMVRLAVGEVLELRKYERQVCVPQMIVGLDCTNEEFQSCTRGPQDGNLCSLTLESENHGSLEINYRILENHRTLKPQNPRVRIFRLDGDLSCPFTDKRMSLREQK